MSVMRYHQHRTGSAHFAETIQGLKTKKSDLLVECLTGDFAGNEECIRTVATSGLDVYAHNVRFSHICVAA